MATEEISRLNWRAEAGKITVSCGEHELRIQKTSYEPIIRYLQLGCARSPTGVARQAVKADRGDQSLDLTKVKLQPTAVARQ